MAKSPAAVCSRDKTVCTDGNGAFKEEKRDWCSKDISSLKYNRVLLAVCCYHLPVITLQVSKLLFYAGNKKQAIKLVLVYCLNKVIMHRFHTAAHLNALVVLLIFFTRSEQRFAGFILSNICLVLNPSNRYWCLLHQENVCQCKIDYHAIWKTIIAVIFYRPNERL